MKEVKLLIKEELRKVQRQEHIINVYSPLKESTEDKIISDYINITSKLLDEGYRYEELDIILEGDLYDRVKSGFKSGLEGGGVIDMANKTWNKTNVGGALSGGLMSAIKERIILGILNYLGLKGTIVKDLVVAFNDFDVREILYPFKNKEYCLQYSPKLMDALSEVLLSHVIEKQTPTDFKTSTDPNNMAKIGIRNVIAQALKQSNFGETLGSKFCSTIWK